MAALFKVEITPGGSGVTGRRPGGMVGALSQHRDRGEIPSPQECATSAGMRKHSRLHVHAMHKHEDSRTVYARAPALGPTLSRKEPGFACPRTFPDDPISGRHRTRHSEPFPSRDGCQGTRRFRRKGLMATPQVLPEPEGSTADTTSLFERYLVFYRETVIRKASSLSEPALRASRLPSGWSPIELVRHRGYRERRWIVWGSLGEPVDEPW